ncbi:MAG TPA: SLBB domain-containing protein [Firmicutes bacterium]|nr:SLBB domain-containing protein [Bacillota bacterium]
MSKFTKRGVFLPSLKEPAASRPIADIPVPAQVFVPLLAPGGEPCRPAVGNYETVLRGEPLGLLEGSGAPAVYAPVTGVLSDVRTMTHPLLGDISCAVLDGMAGEGDPPEKREVSGLTVPEVLAAARAAGIIDELDGAPLADKLESWGDTDPYLLGADGTEQEPYSSSAWAVLGQAAPEVSEGLRLAALAAGAIDCHIAVRRGGRQRRALAERVPGRLVCTVRRKYPAVPEPRSAVLPVRTIGVQACQALYRACAYGEPQSRCVVTVAGDAVKNPQNVRVPVGTLVQDLLHFCGLSQDPSYVILGDAMTGTAIPQADIAVVPGISCILALTVRPQPKTRACIGCGRCVRACHADLLPFEIMRRMDNMQYERLSRLLTEDCDGCGACSYVCPAGLDVAAKVMEARDAKGTIFLKWGDGDDL